MKGDFTSYTQKPENVKLYCASKVAQIAGCSNPTVHRIAKQLNIEARIYKSKNSRASYFTYEEMKIICENFDKHGNDYRTMKLPKPLPCSDKAEDHPLVTDKRCLDFNYWPDVTPVCFQETEE